MCNSIYIYVLRWDFNTWMHWPQSNIYNLQHCAKHLYKIFKSSSRLSLVFPKWQTNFSCFIVSQQIYAWLDDIIFTRKKGTISYILRDHTLSYRRERVCLTSQGIIYLFLYKKNMNLSPPDIFQIKKRCRHIITFTHKKNSGFDVPLRIYIVLNAIAIWFSWLILLLLLLFEFTNSYI